MITGRTIRRIRRSVAGLDSKGRERLRSLLRESSFELPPNPRVIDDVHTRLIPGGVRLAVVSTLDAGIDFTIDISCHLAAMGFDVTPHLTARSVRDEAHLEWITSQMSAAGISKALAVGGDGDPTGKYSEASDLIPALASRLIPQPP